MSDSKTEKPTPRRRQKAREQGQVARSRDLSGILAVSGAFGLVACQGYAGIDAWRSLLRHTFEFSSAETLTPATPLLVWAGWTVARCAVPVMAAAWSLSLAGGLAQGGLVFAPEALVPKVERLSPAQKLSQIFSLTGLSGLLKSLLPFAAICYVGFATLRDHWIGIVVASTPIFGRSTASCSPPCSKSPGNPPWCCSPGPWWTTS
jgi:flagellar biosynthetic protein FlhB